MEDRRVIGVFLDQRGTWENQVLLGVIATFLAHQDCKDLLDLQDNQVGNS